MPASDETFLTHLQQRAFHYFLRETDTLRGLIADSTRADSPCSIAAVGMALTGYGVAAERGLMPRAEAVARTLATLRFFANSPQSPEPDATGFRGFYYHFLDRKTGRRAWKSELSSIDTALLVAGFLAAAAFFDGETADEREIRETADRLYRRVEWDWMLGDGSALSHGWRPPASPQRGGFLRWRWQGYNEALLLYLLALGAPEHAIPPESYAAWTETYRWKTIYGHEYLYAGPLFIHQLPHCWVDFRGIRDAFMRAHRSDYFENSRWATLVQQEYAIRNPRQFRSYGAHCWGLTASDGPGPARRVVDGRERTFYDYTARGVPHGPDDGTIAPWAAAASLPFAPEIVLPTLRHFVDIQIGTNTKYGFEATFNPTFLPESGGERGWVSSDNFGINQGPIVLMIENYLTGRVWQRMRGCAYLQAGLRRAGFRGGWLEDVANPA